MDKFYEGNLLEAVYKATEKLRGAYDLGVVCKDNNNELVAVRKDSPLIVGVGEDENFIASDIPVILKYTRDVIFLENDEYVHMQRPKVTILDENKNVVEKKIKEISYVHAEAFAAGELKHGSIALIDKGTPVVAIATQGKLFEKMVSNMQEVRARGARVIAITQEGNTEVEKSADRVIYIPKVDDMFASITAVVPMQLLAYHASNIRGLDVDKPRNLAKSVTVE